MAAALGTFSALSQSKPLRIEGHTSNVEGPILYRQFITATIGETTEAGDTYIVPHQFDNVQFINAQPLDAVGQVFLTGDDAAGVFYADAASVAGPTQITTAAAAGAATLILVSGSAINDVYNGCYLDIRFSDGDIQTVKITDYVGATTTATIDQGLAKAVAATGSYYTVKGTLATTGEAAATPTVRWEVIGSFIK